MDEMRVLYRANQGANDRLAEAEKSYITKEELKKQLKLVTPLKAFNEMKSAMDKMARSDKMMPLIDRLERLIDKTNRKLMGEYSTTD